ncbi:endoplasmic reticulum junction formation protein lunapark-A [Brienomyrus brachyistius]|uniref:endoplasmic reticulum junction formation protein lunapark-A n=1 Tax=Brienomyrus brachyistius TaxID=42636 RepID=UPI0020B27A1A|nr:endoplasmic reticulum junction formation protein lunapark-A [Brienomyrus brachyistius]XP_048835888.1 endoplasmic reticulum junction formation protein lunapark-A [Brienomyrus brachyistius]XP_048835889.1 endoplasmic reticulum junction formation protein lunapark-A [Brienomyrus brachyistius]
MGSLLSRWKTKPSTVDILENLEKDIQHLEEFRVKNQRVLKLWVGRLLLYSSVLYLLTCISVYLWCLPEQWTERLILALPFFLFPILVWFTRKLLIILFSKRTERNNEKLDELRSKKKKILEEVMETETYKNAKLILERFDPDSKKTAELESNPTGSQATPRPGQELRQRNVTPKPPVMGTPIGSAAQPPTVLPATPSGPPLRSAPGGPPERGLATASAQQTPLRRPVPPGIIMGMGMHPPGPPLARPILPRERGTMDRIIEYMVGDGPQNRYALICQQCFSHNGMALKEEYEYIAFRCAYCYVLNPARKTRPQAPRLPEFSFERSSHPEMAALASSVPEPSAESPDPAEKEPDASAAEPGSPQAVVAQEDSVAEGPGTPELESAPV